ncbi:hypothetical protein GCM10012280_19400 [Wenjunlia tyrosinilytica]|uniref:Uncharacterized protein n=1 Tax=Wenjunlia tyrosinilytica TaxID=1544741 RepID=A0A917ZL32_9ACTN|nr:hypothetical protein GCM10012280_19400 [Wenjunlia tyrosinilytica]
MVTAQQAAEAWQVGERVAAEPHLALASCRFSMQTQACSPVHGRAFMEIGPVHAGLAMRFVEWLGERE